MKNLLCTFYCEWDTNGAIIIYGLLLQCLNWCSVLSCSFGCVIGEPINGAGHLDLDVEVTSGDEGSQPVLQEALQDGIVSAPPDMASVVASTASQPLASHPDSALMHGQAYSQSQQPEEQHAIYSTYVPPNAMYPPHAMAYPHPPVTTFQMIDPSVSKRLAILVGRNCVCACTV